MNLLPLFSSLLTLIFPPCASIIDATIDNPSPFRLYDGDLAYPLIESFQKYVECQQENPDS